MAKIDEAERILSREQERLAEEEKQRLAAEEFRRQARLEEEERQKQIRIKKERAENYFKLRVVADNEIRTYWEEWWRKFGVKFDPAKVVVPPRRSDFDHVLMIPKGLRLNFLRDICRSLFPCSFPCRIIVSRHKPTLYDADLDAIVTAPPRALQAYAIRLRNKKEAEDPWVSRHRESINLPERMVYEIDCFKASGGHLDIVNKTFCISAYTCYHGGERILIRWYDSSFTIVGIKDEDYPECLEFVHGIHLWKSLPKGSYLRAVIE